jgi:phosphoglycolate phosphatase-like HAD superfamily hydrolase
VFVHSLDAIHLATASAEGFERIRSNDRHLLAAAQSFGLEAVKPIRVRQVVMVGDNTNTAAACRAWRTLP